MRIFFFLCGACFLFSGSAAFCAPDIRTVLVADCFSSSADLPAQKLRDGILSGLRAGFGKGVTFVNDRAGAVTSGFSLTDLSSDDFLRALCDRSNAAWIVFGSASGGEIRVFMYDYSRGMVHLFSPAAQGKDPAGSLIPSLSRLLFLISSADAFFLHSSSPLVYVRDIADFGFTGDRLNLNYPYGLFVRGDGRLLCAASGTVAEWDAEGRVIAHYGRRGGAAGEYTSSMKVSAGRDGTVCVSDMSGKAILYPEKGAAREIGFSQVPALIMLSSSNRLFVFNKGSGEIELYGSGGKKDGAIQLNGDTPYQITSDGESVLLLVSRGDRLVLRRFSPEGDPAAERVLPLADDDVVITSFGADRSGNVFIMDSANRAVIKIAPDGSIPWVFPFAWAGPSGQISNPFDIAVSRDGRRLYVADSSNRRVVVFGEFTAALAPSVKESVAIDEPDRRLASCGEILRRDPMNPAALEVIIEYYSKTGAYRQAYELCRKYAASVPTAQKRMPFLSARAFLRDAEGFASLYDEARASGDSAAADFCFDESLLNYDRSLSAMPDAEVKAKRDALAKKKKDARGPARGTEERR